jgi:hypothetical protein
VELIKSNQIFCGHPARYLVWTQRINNFSELGFAVYVSCAAVLSSLSPLYPVAVGVAVAKMLMLKC